MKISANAWFLLSCVGILCGFVLFAMIFGSSETYEVKNTMPVLPIENEVLMRGDEITKEDIGDIVGKTRQLTRESFKHQKNSHASEQSSTTLTAVDDPTIGGTQRKILGTTKDGKAIVGYTKDGTPIVELELKKISQPHHWSDIQRNGATVSEQMGQTKRQIVPIKATAKVSLDHAISNLDGSSTVIGTLKSNSIGKLNDLDGATIKGSFYSIKDSNKMYLQFSKIISKKGTDISISAYAISSDGSAGIPADVNNNIGNEVINFLTNQLVASQTNDVGRIVLDKSVGQTELETQRNVSVKKGTRFTIYFYEPVFI